MANNVAKVAVPQVPPMYPPQEAQIRRGDRGDSFGSLNLTTVTGGEFSRTDEECGFCGSVLKIVGSSGECPNGCKATDDLIGIS